MVPRNDIYRIAQSQEQTTVTLLASALTCGRASMMYSLCDCALTSINSCKYFSSSLLRRPLTPTIGWLDRVIVAWLSGCIHDNTFKNQITTSSLTFHHCSADNSSWLICLKCVCFNYNLFCNKHQVARLDPLMPEMNYEHRISRIVHSSSKMIASKLVQYEDYTGSRARLRNDATCLRSSSIVADGTAN